jgi:hypothetical protein
LVVKKRCGFIDPDTTVPNVQIRGSNIEIDNFTLLENSTYPKKALLILHLSSTHVLSRSTSSNDTVYKIPKKWLEMIIHPRLR